MGVGRPNSRESLTLTTDSSPNSRPAIGVAEPFSREQSPFKLAMQAGAWWPFAEQDSRWINWPTGFNGAMVGQHFIDTDPAGAMGGSPLVCVHGNPTWSYYWKGLIASQRDRRRCIAVDHVGCGWSSRPDVTRPTLAWHIDHLSRLLDALDLRDVTLAVHDWGGAIGIGAALERLDRVSRLVVFNTAAFPPPYIPFRIRVCRWPVLGPTAILGANAFSRAALRMAVEDPRHLTADERRGLLAPYDRPATRRGQLAFVRDIPLGPSHPTWETLQRIEAGLPRLAEKPICLIWGMRDWCFRPECLDRLVEHWPSAEVHRLNDIGHYVVLEAAPRVEAIVARFLERTDG